MEDRFKLIFEQLGGRGRLRGRFGRKRREQ